MNKTILKSEMYHMSINRENKKWGNSKSGLSIVEEVY